MVDELTQESFQTGDNDETELLTLTESALKKLYKMSDEEFGKLELYLDIDICVCERFLQ